MVLIEGAEDVRGQRCGGESCRVLVANTISIFTFACSQNALSLVCYTSPWMGLCSRFVALIIQNHSVVLVSIFIFFLDLVYFPIPNNSL